MKKLQKIVDFPIDKSPDYAKIPLPATLRCWKNKGFHMYTCRIYLSGVFMGEQVFSLFNESQIVEWLNNKDHELSRLVSANVVVSYHCYRQTTGECIRMRISGRASGEWTVAVCTADIRTPF